MKKIVFITLLLFILTTGLLLWQKSVLDTTSKKLKEVTAQSTLKTSSNHRLQLQAQADSLFFAGEIEKATSIYKALDKGSSGTTHLMSSRINWLKNTDSLSANLIKESQSLRQQLEVRNKKIEELTSKVTYLHLENKNNRSLLKQYQTQLAYQKDSLVNLLRIESERIKKNSKFLQDTISFHSSKNYHIRYYGEIKDGKANGSGVGMWSSGGYYYGTWQNNRRHGHGTYHWKDGEYYIGEYSLDVRKGIGTYYWNNGEKYEGSWENDQRNGFGTLYDPVGRVKFKGIWENDQPEEL